MSSSTTDTTNDSMRLIPAAVDPVFKYISKKFDIFYEQSKTHGTTTPTIGTASASATTSIPGRPLIIGISGPQGSGKSTLVSRLGDRLRSKNLNVVEFSIDDFYKTHEELAQLAAEGNSLWQRRGLPGTHDVDLCLAVLDSLIHQRATDIPVYDKSKFAGQGDRSSKTMVVEPNYDIVLVEGWCVGFRALDEAELVAKYNSLIAHRPALAARPLEDIVQVNKALQRYNAIWDTFDDLVQLQAEDIDYVYQWRTQQEHDLIAKSGAGMSDPQVTAFVDGYMPAYDMWLDTVGAQRGFGVKLTFEREIRAVL